MQRSLILMCIIAALIMAAFKPARGAQDAADRCAALKTAATGRYALCAMQETRYGRTLGARPHTPLALRSAAPTA